MIHRSDERLIANNNNYDGAVEQLNRAEEQKKNYTNVKKAQCLREIVKGKAYVHGHDKQGRPLMIVHAGMHDLEDRDLNEMMLMTLWWTEQAIARMPPNCTRFTLLLDIRDCTKQVDSEYLHRISKIFQVLFKLYVHTVLIDITCLSFTLLFAGFTPSSHTSYPFME